MSNLITLNQNAKVAELGQVIQSGIKSIKLLAQRDEPKVQRYTQAFLAEFARRPELQACTQQSVFNAFMFSIQTGLMVGGPRPQAALIEYKKSVKSGKDWVSVSECQLQPMYPGISKLMYETGIVESVNNELILTDGTTIEKYSIEAGSNPKISHTLDIFGIRKNVSLACMPNPPVDALERFCVAAYTVIPLKTGGAITSTPLDTGYLMRIRQTSKGAFRFEKGQHGKPDTMVPNLKHPWFVWWEKMAKKSSLISASKDLPAVDNMDQLFKVIRFDELQSMGELKTHELAEELGIEGIKPDPTTTTQFVSAGIPADDPEEPEVVEPAKQPEPPTAAKAKPVPANLKALKGKLVAGMAKVGIKAAPDQVAVYNAIIGDDSKLNESSVEAAQFLLESSAAIWDKVQAKYGANTEAVILSSTGDKCKTFVDVIVEGETELLRQMVE